MILTDGRFVLRAVGPDDAAALFEAVTASVAELSPWMPWCAPGYTRKEARDWCAGRAAEWAEGTSFDFAVWSAPGAEPSADATPDAAAPRVAAEGVRFTALRGRLPWPVPGVVTERFGVVVNRDLGTRTSSPGIVIAAAPSTEVRAVAAGRVVRVQTMDEYGRLVFVRHGDYLTLYANLSSARVAVGDAVAAGDEIGRSGTDAEPRGAALFFAVFHDGAPEDPTRWLVR